MTGEKMEAKIVNDQLDEATNRDAELREQIESLIKRVETADAEVTRLNDFIQQLGKQHEAQLQAVNIANQYLDQRWQAQNKYVQVIESHLQEKIGSDAGPLLDAVNKYEIARREVELLVKQTELARMKQGQP